MKSSEVDSDVNIELSKTEALVLFEWLARNAERNWSPHTLIEDVAERQLLYQLEGALEKVLVEPFKEDYKEIVKRAYRNLIPNPEDYK